MCGGGPTAIEFVENAESKLKQQNSIQKKFKS